MTDMTRFAPDIQAAANGMREAAADRTRHARDAVGKAVKSARETATEAAQHTRTFARKKARDAHHAAEEHPLGVAIGAFAIGLGVGFLIARNLD